MYVGRRDSRQTDAGGGERSVAYAMRLKPWGKFIQQYRVDRVRRRMLDLKEGGGEGGKE